MKYLKVFILMLVCAALIVGYYYSLSHREVNTVEDTQELTEMQKLLATNLETSYPPTPREVIKYYNRILSCYYNEENSEEDIEELAMQQRMLMDEELLEKNPQEQFLDSVKQDILVYRSSDRTIVDYTVSDSNDITYETVEGKECAYVMTSYFMKERNSYTKSYQEYVLRQDEDKNWKVVAFELTEGNISDDE